MRDLVKRFKHDSRLPEIAGERCVHALMENASCNACVEICPKKAWLLDDDSLGLDTQACDGCGLCVSVCPEGAIELDGFSLLLRNKRGKPVAFGACEYAKSSSIEGIIPCIHALRLQDILRLLQKGVQYFSITTGDCCQCSRSGKNDLQDRVNQLNHALHEMHLEGIVIKYLKQNEWHHLLNNETDQPAGPGLDRRHFFRALISAGVEHKLDVPNLFVLDKSDFVPPGKSMPQVSANPQWPFIPVIATERCNGCDACIQLCPHQAVTIKKKEAGTSYQIDPANCTGCNVCVDVCEHNAVSIKQWATAETLEIKLTENRCKACGNSYHLPASQKQGSHSLCQICSRHNHYKNLHQVLS